MPIKLNLPSKETKEKVLTASTGGYIKTSGSGSSHQNRSYAATDLAVAPMSKFAQASGGVGAIMTQPMFFSPLHTPQNWQIASKRREVYQWARFYYENESKVAAAVDFYSSFPMNGFELECKSKKVLKFFQKVADDINLNALLKLVSKEYFLLGDVFPFKEIHCSKCGGSGVTQEGDVCSHPGGKIKRIVILNPDWVEVQKSILASEPVIAMVPDEELRSIVQRRQPRQIYDKLPPALVELVASGHPIPLSNRSVSHLKHNETPYGVYGISLLRRCFQILAYKTKIMTANWIVAERMILPVRVVKVGNDNRPAGPEDIADVANQLAHVSNDPNLTLVTHHAFEYDWHGATGKIHQITQELEYIGKEILDGFMLNQSLLNGEGPAYGCHDAEYTKVWTNHGLLSYDELFEEQILYVAKEKELAVCGSGEDVDVIYEEVISKIPRKDIKVLVFDPETGESRYEFPIDYHEYDYDGEMIKISGNKLDMMVTPNHKMLAYKRNKKDYYTLSAEEFSNINDSNRYVRACANYNSDTKQNSISIGGYEFDTDNFLAFLGYYLAEGSSTYLEKSRNYRVVLSQSRSANKQHCDEIDDIFSKLEISSRKYATKDTDHWHIHNKQFTKEIKSLFGKNAFDKKIPDKIKNLPANKLRILIDAFCNGDASWCEYKNSKAVQIGTVSKQLQEDLFEILFKAGYSPIKSKFTKKNKSSESHMIYCNLSEDSNECKGRYSRVKDSHISHEHYKGKVWCLTVSTGFFITERNGKIAIQGNSAQVGIEAMIQRLESWRSTLAEWVEKHIFLPIAMMQGFIDEEESKELGETVYLYPRLKFNDMNLRDDSNSKQMMMQLHDKKLISSRKLLDIFDIDYDQMIEEIREETTLAGATGQIGGDMGGPGGGMGGGMMGGMGGAPMGGGMEGGMGGDMGLGMEGGMDGGMGGDMGGDMGGGMMGAAAGGEMPGLKIGRKGKGKSTNEQMQMMMPKPKMIKLTSLEQKMLKTLLELDVPYKLFGQYQVQLQGAQRPYMIDFAYPQLGIGVEADGAMWHAREDLRQRDAERDQKLASVGWTIMRFSESEINESLTDIKDVVYQNVVEAAKAKKSKGNKKKSAVEDSFVKTAAIDGHRSCSSTEELLNKEIIIDDTSYKMAVSGDGMILYSAAEEGE